LFFIYKKILYCNRFLLKIYPHHKISHQIYQLRNQRLKVLNPKLIKETIMNIFVGNLSKDVTDDDLQNLFSGYGNIRNVKIIRDMFSGESKGFGFLEIPGTADAQKAINDLNAKELKGKKIVVNEARPKNDNRRRGGSGGSKGGGRGWNRGGNGGRKSW
jgi:RNA recognition motif-containing protein